MGDTARFLQILTLQIASMTGDGSLRKRGTPKIDPQNSRISFEKGPPIRYPRISETPRSSEVVSYPLLDAQKHGLRANSSARGHG